VTPAAFTAYPFGCPDAANEALDPSDFVSDGLPYDPGVVSPDAGPDVRVLVGRMGAGKTRCLVEVKRNLHRANTCDLTDIEFDLPSLNQVYKLAEDLALEPNERAEVWQKIWKRAIVRAALSRVLPRVPEDNESAKRVREAGPALVSDSGVPHSIYAEFGAILSEHTVLSQLRGFLNSGGWDTIDHCFEELVKGLDRPLCFFLDTGEDDSSHAPRYWLWCQLGLVRQVLELTQNDRLADKLRIFVAIRDQAWAELSKAGKPSKFEQHPKVRQLRWDVSSAAQFLAAKIRELPDEHVLAHREDTDDPRALVTAWLGAEYVSNGGQQDGEPIAQYLLRHTRLIPRDIVSVGNLLNEEVLAAREREKSEVSAPCIHAAVAEAARLAATEELHSCALEVIAEQLAGAPTASARLSILHEEAAGRTVETIKELLGRCDKEVVARETMKQIDGDAEERFKTSISLTDMLWRRGLLGWGADEGGPFTFGVGPSPPPPPRKRAKHAALHPCLVDVLALEAADSPIVPFAVDDLS
jgi:hypothetical protein